MQLLTRGKSSRVRQLFGFYQYTLEPAKKYWKVQWVKTAQTGIHHLPPDLECDRIIISNPSLPTPREMSQAVQEPNLGCPGAALFTHGRIPAACQARTGRKEGEFDMARPSRSSPLSKEEGQDGVTSLEAAR